MEKMTEVKTYRVDYICDACGIGRMILTGSGSINPSRYIHKCSECGHFDTFSCGYPVIRKVEVDDKNYLGQFNKIELDQFDANTKGMILEMWNEYSYNKTRREDR